MAAYTPKYSKKPSNKKGLLAAIRRRFPRIRKKKALNAGKPQLVGVTGRPLSPGRTGFRVRLLLFVVPLVVVLGGWLSYQCLVRSDIFRLTEVSVTGNRKISRRQLIEKTGLTRGTNLFVFDVKAAEKRADELAWADQVDIHIFWPSRVVVTVRERQPLALVNLAGDKGRRLFYVEGDGAVFSPVQPGQDNDFPVITGELTTLGLEGDHISTGTIASKALEFLHLAARGNAILPVQAISEIHVNADLGLIVYLVDRPFPIYVGTKRIRTKYYRLVKILERLYRKKKIAKIKEIRMDYTENKVLVAMVSPGG
ncbi:MAG TPA: FtsQ-type POTRA domain-containing protein [Desulfobulbus sp.]|nr:FtsQ-type POTRA domain-containing protein [Desulfobulbus sp.]HHD63210.1 FtsQ-type POTRA domain-containing protein [Desulfobulbaceae bacterium]